MAPSLYLEITHLPKGERHNSRLRDGWHHKRHGEEAQWMVARQSAASWLVGSAWALSQEWAHGHEAVLRREGSVYNFTSSATLLLLEVKEKEAVALAKQIFPLPMEKGKDRFIAMPG